MHRSALPLFALPLAALSLAALPLAAPSAHARDVGAPRDVAERVDTAPLAGPAIAPPASAEEAPVVLEEVDWEHFVDVVDQRLWAVDARLDRAQRAISTTRPADDALVLGNPQLELLDLRENEDGLRDDLRWIARRLPDLRYDRSGDTQAALLEVRAALLKDLTILEADAGTLLDEATGG